MPTEHSLVNTAANAGQGDTNRRELGSVYSTHYFLTHTLQIAPAQQITKQAIPSLTCTKTLLD